MTRRERWARAKLEENMRQIMATLAILFAPFALLAVWTWMQQPFDPAGGFFVPLFVLPAMAYAAVWPWLGTVTRRPRRIIWTATVLALGLAVTSHAVMAATFNQPVGDPCDRCALAIPYSVEWWACLIIGCW